MESSPIPDADGARSGSTDAHVHLDELELEDLVARLGERESASPRYQVVSEIGRGGMGLVYRVRDLDLHRDLAMKVLLPRETRPEPTTANETVSMRARFLEEAQVASQLDHPGIVPIHDLGLDANGRLYFTMKLVHGRSLEEILRRSREGDDAWSTTRILGILVRICEAMSYAHDRGVIHRDLKPANVMVGEHGEVYVMDWGLARILPATDAPAPRRESTRRLQTARHNSSTDGTSSAFVTEYGRVMGTPAYMSPEQASGGGDAVGPWSDVYAVGCILHQVLTGWAPYCSPGEDASPEGIWESIRSHAPKSTATLNPKAPPELNAICERAMQRAARDRYADMGELGEDIRAYLELRVVSAYRTGPVVELRKWLARNRGVASLGVALISVLIGAGFVVAWRERVRADGLALRARAHEVSDLLQRADQLWPIHPDEAPRMRAWLAEADRVLTHQDSARREWDRLGAESLAQGRARPAAPTVDPDLEVRIEATEKTVESIQAELTRARAAASNRDVEPERAGAYQAELSILPAELSWWNSKAAELASRRVGERLQYVEPLDAEEYQVLESLTHNLDRLRKVREEVAARSRRAEEMQRESLASAGELWSRAIESIGDRSACPRYDGLVLTPQTGLVPLHRDAETGLWEFHHVLSGAAPRADGHGRWILTPDTGIVLILVPGGTFTAGAQSKDPSAASYDRDAQPTEGTRSARLDPYFLSKYEVTQSQWERMTGEMPSRWFAGWFVRESPVVTRIHPVESVNWFEATRTLSRHGLMLPTELQWEHAERAGTSGRFGASDDFASIRGEVNFADNSFRRGARQEPAPELGTDGSRIHLPVDAFEPNGFGFHDMLGNVSELCLDAYTDTFDRFPPRDGDGLVQPAMWANRPTRGGSYATPPTGLRMSARQAVLSSAKEDDVGLRPARPVERTP